MAHGSATGLTRTTTVVVDRLERDGFAALQEEGTGKPGFVAPGTVSQVRVSRPIRPGDRLRVTVEDRSDLFIVRDLSLV